MPQFPRQSTRPESPRRLRASLRHGHRLLAQIERNADPQDAREKQRLTRAIHGLSAWAQQLSRRHQGQSVVEDIRAQHREDYE